MSALKKTLSVLLVYTCLLSIGACGTKTPIIPDSEHTSTSGADQGGNVPSAPDTSETTEPTPDESELPLGVTTELVGTTFYVRGRGPMKDYDTTPFQGKGITELVVEDGVTSIGDYAFANFNSLKKVTLPETLERIGKRAFEKTPIEEIDFPASLTDIGVYAFDHCLALALITGGEGVERIGGGALNKVPYVEEYNGERLLVGHCYVKHFGSGSEVVVPDGIKSIGETAFEGCKTLGRIVLPEGLLTIGNKAFFDCVSLTSVHIPDSVHTIDAGAFAGCSALETVTGGNGLLYVGADIFLNTRWRSQNRGDYLVLGSALLEYRGNQGEVVVPDGIKAVAATVFQLQKDARSIYLPDGLVSIGVRAFFQCKADTISVPASVEYMGKDALMGSRISKIFFRGTPEQWKIMDETGNAYSVQSVTVEYIE